MKTIIRVNAPGDPSCWLTGRYITSAFPRNNYYTKAWKLPSSCAFSRLFAGQSDSSGKWNDAWVTKCVWSRKNDRCRLY